MIRKLLLVTLIAVTLGVRPRPVLAQVTIGGEVKTSHNTIDQGFFHVMAQQDGVNPLLFHVTVDFDHPASTASPAPPFVDEIDVRLLSGINAPFGDAIASASGEVGAYPYSTFLFPSLGQVDFFAPLDAGGSIPGSRVTAGQTFTGNILLQAGDAPVTAAYFNLVGSGSGSGNGTYDSDVSPEGASLFLLLPGLLPIAAGLYRRRNKPAR